MSLKLKRGLDKILREWGHDIILQRSVSPGNKYVNKFERHTVRHNYPVSRGLPRVLEEEPEGMVHNVDLIYYFRADAKPKEDDRIYEDRGERGFETYIIDWALPMRGRGGKVVFYACGATREEPN